MGMIIWLMIAILVLLITIGLLALMLLKRKKTPPDYYSFFVMGIVWLPLGIVLKNYLFSAMGMIFMIAGLLNKDKWKKNRRDFRKMTKEERKLTAAIMMILALSVLAGLVFMFVFMR